MSEAQKEPEREYSLQNAMDKLAEVCAIIVENNEKIFMKKAEEIDAEVLEKLAESLVKCGYLFNEFLYRWDKSELKGPDAFRKSDKLEDRIDIKLYETGKLDFDKMKKVMARLHRIDDIMLMEEIMTPYFRQYANLCKEKGLSHCADLNNSFESNFVERLRTHLENERMRLGNQIERCNLYYQAKLNTRTVRIAWGHWQFQLSLSLQPSF